MERIIIFENGRLICIGHEHTRVPAVLSRLHGEHVVCLDLSNNKLISLQGIDLFPILEELIVDNNDISENVVLPYVPSLQTFSVNKNKIQNLEIFLPKVKENMPKLRYLSLLGNSACPDQLSDLSHDEEDYARYRCYVLHYLPNLVFLDSSPVLASEVAESKARGHLLRVAKPKLLGSRFNESYNGDGSPRLGEGLTPLPRTRREIGDHQGKLTLFKVPMESAGTNILENIPRVIDLSRIRTCEGNSQLGIKWKYFNLGWKF